MRSETLKTHGLPALIRLWLGLTALFPRLFGLVARSKHKRRAALPERFCEVLGQATQPRPSGRLVWVHAVSVGEVNSVARLARQFAGRAEITVLITTVTATGAATAARVLPDALHQFMPVDTPVAVQRFLAHWRPDAALFVEGDLWPRMILSLAAQGCPMVLVNARASRSRMRFPAASGALLAQMQLVTVQDPALMDEMHRLGIDPARIHAPGNLKADIDRPAVDERLRDQMIAAAQGRGIWAAVSTHPGEESLLLDAQGGLSAKPLLILVPRHPERGRGLAAELARRGLVFTQHSKGETPDPHTQVHLVDALGVTGTVYAAAGLAFVGGSLVTGHGGHTPFEPVALGCAVLSGPHVQNFTSAYASLQAAGAACLVADATALAGQLEALLSDDAARRAMQQAARKAYEAQGGATARTLEVICAALPDSLGAQGRALGREAGP